MKNISYAKMDGERAPAYFLSAVNPAKNTIRATDNRSP